MAQFSTDDIFRDNPLVEVVAARAGVRVDRNGKGEWLCLCPFHSENTPSFSIYDSRKGHQRFTCYGCGADGDVIDFVRMWESCTFAEACERLGGKREWNDRPREKSAPREVRDPYAGFVFKLPPADAPELVAGTKTPQLFNPKRADDGKPFTAYTPSMVFPYRARDGRLIGYVLRIELGDGKKITPTIVWMQRPDGAVGWCHGALPEPRPPYRCETIAASPADAQVIIVEGEKSADAAARLFPKALVLSWIGGTNAYDRTKWDSIGGRSVVLWSDNDPQGLAAMLGKWRRDEWLPGLAEILADLSCRVRIIGLDPSKAKGWDIADGEAEGWKTADAVAYAKANAKPVDAATIESHKEASRDGAAQPSGRSDEDRQGRQSRDTSPQEITTAQEKPEPKPKAKPAEREKRGNVEAIHGASIPQGVEIDRHGQWRAKLQTNDEGKLRPKSFLNACLMVEHHEEFRDLFAWDEFGARVLVTREPNWGETLDVKYPAPVTDTLIMKLRGQLERKGINMGTNEIGAAAMVAAVNNPVNTMREFLESLKWDGEPRLSGGPSKKARYQRVGWLTEYLGAAHSPINAAFGRRWLIAAVARALDPGCKVDNMLILEGPQGKGKSTVFRVLGTIEGHSYFTDSIDDIHSKDAVQQMMGMWIIEFAELDAMSRAEADSFKKFQTRQDDYIRLPFGKVPQLFKRTCIFGGTINPIGNGYLKDPTGARRYWPVKVGALDLDALRKDRDQLLAEAVHAYRSGEQHWLTDEEDEWARVEQGKRLNQDPWQQRVASFLRGRKTMTMGELMGTDCLSIPTSQQTSLTTKRLAGILRVEGWRRKLVQEQTIHGPAMVETWVEKSADEEGGE